MGTFQRLPATAGDLARALSTLALLASTSGALGGTALRGQEPTEGLRVSEEILYYDVPGTSLSAVVTALNSARLEGPDGAPSQGLTRYFIKPEWTSRASGGACRVAQAEVFVDIDITLPRWSASADRPDDEQERWSKIEAAIREHEYGHRALVLEAAGELLSTIRGLAARGCGTLDDVVTSTLSVADGRLREAHATLDRETPTRLRVGPGS